MNMTDDFIRYLFDKSERIGSGQIQKAKECYSDYHAVVEAGAKKSAGKWHDLLQHLPQGNAPLFGYRNTTDSKTAALINGFNAHCLELDDGQRFAMIHLGASIISAIDAASADFGMLEQDRNIGIVMGYEAACRIAIAMQPSHKRLGYHAAGTCGTVGSAVGSAFALGMNRARMKCVLTAAVAGAAGMLEIQEQNSELKPYNLGRAAMDGLTAAYMGFSGFETPDDMIGGEKGFFKLFSDQCDPAKMTAPENYFEIDRIYVKPYASCRHSHSAVEAAITLSKGLDIGNIGQVVVETYQMAIKGHDHTDIRSSSSAKLSAPYAVAAALIYGKADLSVFEPLDDRVAEMARKVRVVENPALTAECPEKRAAIVTVVMNDGSRSVCRVDYAKGDPENPMTAKELEDKARQLRQFTAGTVS